MSRTSLVIVLVASAALSFCASGCEILDAAGGGGVQSPTMSYQTASLVKSPKTTELLAYYCPSSVSGAVCTPVLGAAPAAEDLRFDFELSFLVDNPNALPIPTLSMLLATTLFQNDPDATDLGATCLKFCDPGDPNCTGQGAEDACAAGDQRELDSLEDFVGSATDQLVNVATGNLDPAYSENLGVRTIPAGGSQELKVVFSLGVDPMLNVLERIAGDAVTSYVNGQEAAFQVPYSMRGTVWFDVPLGLGRFGLPFGPEDAVWQLDM